MSLINDALRRKDQEKKAPTPEKSDGSPMQPVHPPSRDRASLLGPMLMLVIVLLLLVAAILFWKGLHTKNQVTVAAAPPATVQPPPPAPLENATVAPPVPATPVQPVATNLAATESANPSATNASPETIPVVALAAPVPPPLKLQGIFYRPSNPTVMINGKTVGVGELVSGARILKIEREEVTLERNGKQEVLTME